MIKYMGVFFEGEQAQLIRDLQCTKLDNENDEIHCTFKYRPTDDELIDELVGQEVCVYLIAYGCDGKNSGFKIEFDEAYNPYYINFHENKKDEDGNPILKPKHITVSLASGAVAADTKDLTFVKLAEPVAVKGRFGYWVLENDVEHISYEKALGRTIVLK